MKTPTKSTPRTSATKARVPTMPAAAPEGLASNGTLPQGLTPEQLAHMRESVESQAQLVMKKIPILGAVAWLMLQKGATRHTLLSELEWRVMPPLVLEQCKLYLRGDAPTGFVSWAKLSPDIAKRYRGAPHQLGPAEWRSGEEIWLVDFLVPFGGAREVLQDLRSTVFAGKTVHQLAPQQDDEAKVVTWPPL